MSKPFVSVCTPTYNRRKFIPNIIKCFKNQDYPSELLEWIIIDDGTEEILDLFKDIDLKERFTYIKLKNKMPIGAKRNYLNSIAKGEIIVYFDDDDYYPPERVSHAVEALTNSPYALCAGCSEIHIYFNHIGKMYLLHANLPFLDLGNKMMIQANKKVCSNIFIINHKN